MVSFWKAATRKKQYTDGSHLETNLRRCLGLFDVIFLALGQMMGAGIYVLSGTVAHNQAGPSIVLSFLLAGIAALFSAFSYAEFGARFPRAGSAYTYTYVGFGEIWAFLVGWTIPLEYMIGNAAVARSWSSYFDHLIDNWARNTTINFIGEHEYKVEFLADYPDILAAILLILCSCIITFGNRASANVNSILVILNITVIVTVIASGLSYADTNNWSSHGFFPFGLSGTFAGAATCFFSFIGFDILGTAGEELNNPHRAIPIAIFVCISLITILYVLVSSTLTLMVPFTDVDVYAPFANAFDVHNAVTVKYIITIGALIGLSNNLLTGVFALPRAVYAMADDGLLFTFLAKVNPITKVPINAIIVFTMINALITLVFDIDALVEFLSIGTLFAYTFVSAAVIVLRYQAAPIDNDEKRLDNGGTLTSWVPFRNFWESLPAGVSPSIGVMILIASFFGSAFTIRTEYYLTSYGLSLMIINIIISIASFLFILGHEQNKLDLPFKVPCVPFIPCCSLFINTFMMAYLSYKTWIRLFVWMGIGFLIYLFYGVRNSKESKRITSIADIRMSSTFPAKNRIQ